MTSIVKLKYTTIKTNKKISADIVQGKYESYEQKEIHQRKEKKTSMCPIEYFKYMKKSSNSTLSMRWKWSACYAIEIIISIVLSLLLIENLKIMWN